MMNKLWCDMKTDTEKTEFLLSGRAVETGIIAPALVHDFSEVLSERAYYRALCKIYFEIASDQIGEKKVRELRDATIGI